MNVIKPFDYWAEVYCHTFSDRPPVEGENLDEYEKNRSRNEEAQNNMISLAGANFWSHIYGLWLSVMDDDQTETQVRINISVDNLKRNTKASIESVKEIVLEISYIASICFKSFDECAEWVYQFDIKNPEKSAEREGYEKYRHAHQNGMLGYVNGNKRLCDAMHKLYVALGCDSPIEIEDAKTLVDENAHGFNEEMLKQELKSISPGGCYLYYADFEYCAEGYFNSKQDSYARRMEVMLNWIIFFPEKPGHEFNWIHIYELYLAVVKLNSGNEHDQSARKITLGNFKKMFTNGNKDHISEKIERVSLRIYEWIDWNSITF